MRDASWPTSVTRDTGRIQPAREPDMDDVDALVKFLDAGRLMEVKQLLESGVDPNGRNSVGERPIMIAACNNDLDALDLLLQFGAEVNRAYEQGWTALHEAVDCSIDSTIQGGGSPGDEPLESILWLVAHGADLNAKTERGETPLDIARSYRSIRVEQALGSAAQ